MFHPPGEATEMKVTTIGIDLAKNVFQVHGVDEQGKGVLRNSSSVPKWPRFSPTCRQA